MPYRIEVGLKPGLFDARGERSKKQILRAFPALDKNIAVRCIDVYTIDGEELEDAWISEAFCDPVIQNISINTPLTREFTWYIEVGYKPGVTDNVGRSASYALHLITSRHHPVYSARAFLLTGDLSRNQAEKIAGDCLANSLIQYARIMDPLEILEVKPHISVVSLNHVPAVHEVSLDLEDQELLNLSREKTLALNLEEMKAIASFIADPEVRRIRAQAGLGEKLTDVELECFAQTWSEHCKHKIFSAEIDYRENGKSELVSSLFKTYIQGATRDIRARAGEKDICVSVFTDNAGVIRFTDDYHLVFKVETHNSPSALDPYGGALTGIVGVNRDPFGTGIGAKLIFNTDVFCFADPAYAKDLPPKILHPVRIFEGVREGVEHGGNKSGIPTVNGCIVFDDRYLGKPLVYCGTAGIMPVEVAGVPSHKKDIRPGDLIVMSGGRIGKDGIHGATFSSEEFHEESPTSAVQIGDPITQKKLTDFLLRARDLGLYRAITDNGAGGLSSSVGEMSQLSGGCLIELDKPPLKYPGLDPWEILLSEAQERMTLAVAPENIDAFLDLSVQMDVESTVIGTFTDSGYFHCTYGQKNVAYLPLDFLHNGVPRMRLSARWEPEIEPDPLTPVPEDQNAKLEEILSRLNICSKEYVVRQYDHEVQGGSIVKPLVGQCADGPSDAAIVRPVLELSKGVVVSNGIVPRYSDIDTYHMTACALDEALRNYVCVGGDPGRWACLDNFCWCDPVRSERNPDGEHKLAQLVRANMALYDYAVAFSCPLISGKDSMKNDYIGPGIKISIPPTILVSVIGTIPEIEKAVTMDLKRPGDLVYLLGITRKELGASEYFTSYGIVGSSVPKVDAETARVRYRNLHAAICGSLIASAHDLSDGGLAVALAESAFAGGIGAQIDLKEVACEPGMNDTEILYSESQSRILVSVSPERAPEFESMFSGDARRIGRAIPEQRLIIRSQNNRVLIDRGLDSLKRSWKAPLDF